MPVRRSIQRVRDRHVAGSRQHPARLAHDFAHARRPSSLSYRDAGVDIDAGDALVERIKPFAKRTMRPEVLGGIGGFGALIEIAASAFASRCWSPAPTAWAPSSSSRSRSRRHDTIGIDLVAMSVNDILVQGAEPLFFLDYFACGKLDVDVAADVIKGIAAGCEQAGCALIGGETAEMPGMYADGEYDLAGFAVGVVEKIASHRRPQHRRGRRACSASPRAGRIPTAFR